MWAGDLLLSWLPKYGAGWQGDESGGGGRTGASGGTTQGLRLRGALRWRGRTGASWGTTQGPLSYLPNWDLCSGFNREDLPRGFRLSRNVDPVRTYPRLLEDVPHARELGVYTGCVFQLYGVNLVERLIAAALWKAKGGRHVVR